MAAQSKLVSFALVCVLGVAGIAASLIWRQPRPAVALLTGAMLTPSGALPEFSLIDTHGRKFGSAELRGRWSFMFFGYTNCPDFCPTTLATLAAMQKRLRASRFQARPRVVFVSVDPKRDTPLQLAKYVPYFDPEFIGLTAPDQASIDATAKKLGVAVLIRPSADGNYTVDHSGEIFVIDPEGGIAAILNGPFTAEALQTDFQRIVAEHKPGARA